MEQAKQIHNRGTQKIDTDNPKNQIGFMDNTFTEELEHFRQFIVERANAPKEEHGAIWSKHCSQINNLMIRAAAEVYFHDSQKAGLFTNKTQLLSETLSNMYKINYARVTGSREFADRLVDEPQFKKYILDVEAKNLLSGTKLYSTEVAAEEAKKLRDTINGNRQEISDLTTKNNLLTNTFNNLVQNLKSVLGLSPQAIKAYTDEEIWKQQQEEAPRFEMVGKYLIVPLDQDNYPAGVSESDELTVYKEEDNTYTVKHTSNDPDGSFDGQRIEDIAPSKLQEVIERFANFDDNKVRFNTFEGGPWTKFNNREDFVKHFEQLIPKQTNNIKHKL